jgi:hypothetical protein
VIVELHD